ncbi:MAG TPA: hypothetical protein VEC06_00015 [Paucimonas sp.]|nr:hypothetical protein [Paucimonas sp.]
MEFFSFQPGEAEAQVVDDIFTAIDDEVGRGNEALFEDARSTLVSRVLSVAGKVEGGTARGMRPPMASGRNPAPGSNEKSDTGQGKAHSHSNVQ